MKPKGVLFQRSKAYRHYSAVVLFAIQYIGQGIDDIRLTFYIEMAAKQEFICM